MEIFITYISTKDMVANVLTKTLDTKSFKAFRSMIGMDLPNYHKMTEREC